MTEGRKERMSTEAIKVLLVEDDPGHAALLQRSFEDAGHAGELRVVGTLAEGLAAMAREKPDVALVDLVLPDGRGTAVLSLAKEHDIPVIVLTAHGTQKDARDALKEGAADYIVKSPEVFEEAPRIVQRVLQEREAQKKLAEAQQALRRNEALLRAITESAPLAFLAADLDAQRVLYVTRRFAEIWSLQSVQEKLMALRIPLNEVRILCESRLSFERKAPGEDGQEGAGQYALPENHEFLLVDERPEVEFELGNGKIVRQLAVPITDDQGQRIGHLFLFEDITARKRHEARLERAAKAREHLSRLSRRENQVLELVASGLPNRMIAENLAISEKTVEKHRASGLRKLQLRSVASLVRLYLSANPDQEVTWPSVEPSRRRRRRRRTRQVES
ncbi:MAG: response regulator [Planctomycetota bacterium]|nr:MAG: response regulator [Planctomycetota bacterium]